MNRHLLQAFTVVVTLAAAAALPGPTPAAEGMWRPQQLPAFEQELKALGLELPAGSLIRLTEHPMNAVIDLNGCTASFVSSTGLVVTNHHCSWGALQHNSTEERNLLKDGFFAAGAADELPASPGSRVRVTVDVRDVTELVREGLDEIHDGATRYDLVESRKKQLIAECEQTKGHRCRVRSFNGGHEYSLVKQLQIRDVRLVYAPAGSIGVFGGDIDNWIWPRHTGDFTFMRAYVGADGKPADYSKDNVPYRPAHWLRVAPEGVEDGDFVMVTGYPGRTGRYRLADEVANAFEWFYPTMKETMEKNLAIIDELATTYPDVEIKYASAIAGTNNAAKNFQGMIDGFARSDMVQRKRAFEAELQAWIEADPQRVAEHGTTLAALEALAQRKRETQQRNLLLSRIGRSSMLSTARSLLRLAHEKELPDADREPGYQERDMRAFRQRLERLERRYHPEVDKALWTESLRRYSTLPQGQRVAELDAFLKLGNPGGLGKRLDAMYRETRLDELDVRLELMDADRKALESSRDPFLRLAVALYAGDRAREAEEEALEGEFQLMRPRYMETLVAFLGSRGRTVYPDANGGLRVTYGTVKGYSPRDGMVYTPFTRLEGIAEKHTGEEPFDAPALQLEKIAARDHGRYRLEAIDSVPVNYLTTVDTTGGNSGSPTLNGRGELVGLLFDGTYDSINADWDFDERTTRSIHVDIRYVLWVMEKIDGAQRVLKELGL